MTHVINKDELPHSATAHTFEGYRYGDANVSFFLTDAPPRSGPKLHTHPYAEVFVVQEGQATFTVDGAAIEHSAAVGYPLGRYQEMSTLFIVRRHEIEYLRPASPGDVLEVVTWAAEIRGPRAVRAHEVYRHSQAVSDAGTVAVPADILLPATHVLAGEPLVRARTEWVYVGLDSGRPLRVPAELIEAFTGTGTTRPVSGYQAPLG